MEARRAAFLLALLVAATPTSTAALSELPFTPAFAERVESTFFEGGRVSEERVARYRAELAIRRHEAHAAFTAVLHAAGRKRR